MEATFIKKTKTLHLEKSCPTATNAAAGAEVTGVTGQWGFWSDGCGELLPFCPECARRELARDALASSWRAGARRSSTPVDAAQIRPSGPRRGMDDCCHDCYK